MFLNMNTNIENLGLCSIDSLKLRLEIPHLTSFDKSLLDHLTVVNSSTGEVEQEFKRRSKKYNCKEYSFYASYNENVRTSKDSFSDCITLLLNSKQIKGKYFSGLTIDTIKDVYNEVIKLGIINCSFDTFLNATPTDVDFKKDYILELDTYKELIDVCKIMTKPSQSSKLGCNVFKQLDNYGIEWSNRQTTKYRTHPYLKIYHKGIEITTNSIDFYNEYLKPKDVKEVIRIETTVKNRTHFRALDIGLTQFTFIEILNLSQEQKQMIIQKAVNSHLANRTKAKSFNSKLNMTPAHKVLLNSILGFTTELNWSISRIESLLLNGIENKNTKYRQKKLINELYNDHIKDTNYDFKSTKIESFFDTIGWF